MQELRFLKDIIIETNFSIFINFVLYDVEKAYDKGQLMHYHVPLKKGGVRTNKQITWYASRGYTHSYDPRGVRREAFCNGQIICRTAGS